MGDGQDTENFELFEKLLSSNKVLLTPKRRAIVSEFDPLCAEYKRTLSPETDDVQELQPSQKSNEPNASPQLSGIPPKIRKFHDTEVIREVRLDRGISAMSVGDGPVAVLFPEVEGREGFCESKPETSPQSQIGTRTGVVETDPEIPESQNTSAQMRELCTDRVQMLKQENDASNEVIEGMKESALASQEDFEARTRKLEEENLSLRDVIILYEETLMKIEPLLNQNTQGWAEKYEQLKKKFDTNYEEMQHLDRAYKYTYSRYEELKTAFDAQRANEARLLKSNSDMRRGLELTGVRINELLKEAADARAQHDAEVAKLQTNLKLDQLKITGLEKNVQELTRQKDELTQICEEFLNGNNTPS